MAAKQRKNVSNKDKGKASVKAPVVDAKSGAFPSLGYLALIAAVLLVFGSFGFVAPPEAVHPEAAERSKPAPGFDDIGSNRVAQA